MDSVDGQLARLRGGGSVRGEWLDHTIDSFKESSIHLAVAISWFRYPPADDGLAARSARLLGGAVSHVLRDHSPAVPAGGEHIEVVATVRHEHPLRKWLILPTDYGFMCWTFVFIAAPTLFLGVYTTLFGLSAAMLALALRKWSGELDAIDQAKREMSLAG